MGAVCEIETAVVPASTMLMGHRHRRWHLVIVWAGSLDEEVHGRIHTMAVGSCRISPPFEQHNMVVGSDGLTCAIVSLEEAWVDALEFPRSSLFLSSPITKVPLSEIRSGAEKWSSELERELLLRQTLATIRAESDGRDPQHAPSWIKDAGAAMQLTPQDCRIARLVEQSRVSRMHFSITFRKHFGLKPVEYRTAYRLLRALRLLQSSEAPLAEIAHDCGFADQSHLTRALKLKFGITPSLVRATVASPQPTMS
jgi:AraC-like DNA-binding protein